MIPYILLTAPLHGESFHFPKTRSGELAQELIRLCESPGVDRITPWLSANLAVETLKAVPAHDLGKLMSDICSVNGGFEVKSVKKSELKHLVLNVRGRTSDAWFELILELDDKGQLLESILQPTLPPEGSLPKDLSDAAIARDLQNEVQRLGKLGLFSGVVQLSRGNRSIVTATAGYADRGKTTPMNSASQFTLGSLSKMFTAVAVGQLVDQKKLSFDDKVGKYFPDYPNKIIRDQVTVGMLLSHFAGMGRFLDKRTPAMMKNGTKRADEFLPVLMQEELLYPPGTKQGYSNSGFVLAGAIVEKVSGVDYPVYLQKYIFEPSGMVNSHPNHMPQSLPNLVTPYTGFGKDARVAEADLGSPAGGAISTADDLVRFADALRSGKLVSKETLAKMKMSRSPERDGSGYGYGMYNRKFYGLTMVGHGGGTAGVRTHLALFLDAPYTIVVLENVDLPVDFSWNAKAIMAAKARGDK